MALSKDDSTRLWHAVEEQNFAVFSPISQKLLYAQGAPLRHIPLKIYLPSSSSSPAAANEGSASSPTRPVSGGHLRVVQSLITPTASGTREPQTLGSALHMLLPALFPSRRTPILAKPVLHGCVVPMGAPVEELLRNAAYLDGWLHLGVVMMG
ncbi:autophagy protein 5 [Peltigera leucophlebia]|nr:autophagy protein 5 [Peltigera leucophlebia]